MSDKTYIVVCPNPHHRRAEVDVDGETVEVEFGLDKRLGAAVAEDVSAEVAAALVQNGNYDLADASADDLLEGRADSESGDASGGDDGDAEEDAEGGEETGEDLQRIDGIGPARAKNLRVLGIETPHDLADVDAAELADALDVGEETVDEWQAQV